MSQDRVYGIKINLREKFVVNMFRQFSSNYQYTINYTKKQRLYVCSQTRQKFSATSNSWKSNYGVGTLHISGSILSSNCDLTSDVQHRTMQAFTAFGRLSRRVFYNHNLTLATKVLMYKAVCISALLCGCGTWTPYRQHIKALGRCHVRCLRSMLQTPLT